MELSLLDIIGTLLGLLYLVLEMRENCLMWIVGLIMPAVYFVLLYQKGIYADAAMELYYFLAGIYGLQHWLSHRVKTKKNLPISRTPRRLIPTLCAVFVALWIIIFFVLTRFTDSTVPAIDSFTTALSIVALWLLSRKHIEQWLLWLIVDAVSTYLYIKKGIPFRALLYAIYTVMAVYGYRFWKRKMSI